MVNLIRFNPVENTFDDLFRGFLMSPVQMEADHELKIKLDVKEDEQSYTIHAEIPGVQKDDIHVSVEGKQVAISAEVKNEKEVKNGERVLRSERYYGKVSRAFMLAQDVDDTSAQAKYTDGVLELTLPKKAAVTSKRLTIN
jgi:HSP20 family protein